jgi:hypothetical protein
MFEKPEYITCCEALVRLMVRLPKMRGITMKEASRRSKVNLYKYQSNSTFPLTLSLYSFGEAFKIDPEWMIRIASMVDRKQLTEAQGLEILSRWQEFRPYFDNAFQIVLNEVKGQLFECILIGPVNV